MSEDNIYILLGAIILIVLITLSYKYNKNFFWYNFLFFFSYILFFQYKLKFDSEYGTALVWLGIFWICLLIQLLVVLIFLILESKKNN